MKRIDFENGTVTNNILSAALPMLVAQILNLLYNIVDRIYIARIHDIGTTALGAVGLCFPIIMIITAFSNLFGSGGAPIFSINRGKGDSRTADMIMNTAFTMLCGSAAVLMLITSISLDHMQYLGDTVAKIAGEKAGIIVPGVPVIYDGNDPDAAEVIRARAEELGSPAYEVKKSDTEVLRNTSAGIDFAFRNEYYKDMVFSIPFIAKYQVMNSALALKTIEVLQNVISVSMDQIHVGIAGTRWQGRMETVLPGVIVDGAHNEDGVEKFVETAEHFQKECPLTLLFSAVDDKDYTDMIHTICSRITFRQVVVTSVGGYRQVPAERFAKLFTEAGASSVEVVEDVEKAFGRALEVKGDDGMLFCVGSLYLVGEIKDVIRRNKK